MQPKEQYAKYKPAFKKVAILKVVMNALMFATLILLFFLPCFRIQPEGAAEFAQLTGIDLGVNFSVLDEIVNMFSVISSGSENIGALIFFQIVAIAFFAAGIVAATVDFVKSMIGCVNPDNYAIVEYDKIKTKTDRKVLRQFSSTPLFISAIIYEVFAIIMCKVFDRNVGDAGMESGILYIDYFASMNTVAWGFWIVLVFLIADITLAVLTAVARNKLKIAILKDDYEKTEDPAQ